jgi:transcriptional regulator with XRE-family HTH domain
MNTSWIMAQQDPDFRKVFGVRLKELRKNKRWSQKELAAKVDIRFQQLNKYESGLNLPPAEMLIKLADALATTVDYLLTGNPVEDSPLASSRLFMRFRAVEHLADNDQETVITLIDAMIAKQQMQSALQPLDEAATG